MKKLLFLTFLLSQGAFAQQTSPWTETFKLPEGITFRARAAGYDCGTFASTYVNTPSSFQNAQVQYGQLAADKDLNKFLIEATFPSADGKSCIYGVYLDRNRDSKTLDFNHSVISTEGSEESCLEGRTFIDNQMRNVAYEGSKRGLRYIAVEVIKDVENDVCESQHVRIVFDRRPPDESETSQTVQE